jgi:hypothetical protein
MDRPRARLLSLAVLLATSTASAEQVERVTDGGFEEGSSAWTFSFATRCDEAGCFLPAASGSFYATSGPFLELVPPAVVDYLLGTISQSIPVPESPAVLELSLRRVDSESEAISTLWVLFHGELLDQVEGTGGLDFERLSFAIPEASVGGPRLLQLQAFCTNPESNAQSCDRFDIDDVSLKTPEAEADALALAAIALLPTLSRNARAPRRGPCSGTATTPRAP